MLEAQKALEGPETDMVALRAGNGSSPLRAPLQGEGLSPERRSSEPEDSHQCTWGAAPQRR